MLKRKSLVVCDCFWICFSWLAPFSLFFLLHFFPFCTFLLCKQKCHCTTHSIWMVWSFPRTLSDVVCICPHITLQWTDEILSLLVTLYSERHLWNRKWGILWYILPDVRVKKEDKNQNTKFNSRYIFLYIK